MRRTAKTAVYSTTELLVALFIASCCSLVCGLLAVWFDINRAEQVFRQDAKHVQSRIAERIGSTDAALTALSGLYSASERVEAHELYIMARELLEAYPHIYFAAHAARVSAAEQAWLASQLSGGDMHSIGITQLRADGALAPRAARDEYFHCS